MIAFIHFPGDLLAGLISHTFEVDLGDMCDQALEDDKEFGNTENRDFIRQKLTELVEGVQDSGYGITFSDECECGGVIDENHKCWVTEMEEEDAREVESREI